MKVSEYLLLSREERTRHVDLSSPCEVDERVTVSGRRKRGRKALLKKLGLENDVVNWREGGVCVCHLCEQHSKNGWCANTNHLYLGTSSENRRDVPEEVRKKGGQTTLELRKGLFDPKNKEKAEKAWSAGATTTNAKRRLCLVTGHVSNPGALATYQKGRGVSNDLYYELKEPDTHKNLTPLQRLLAAGTEDDFVS